MFNLIVCGLALIVFGIWFWFCVKNAIEVEELEEKNEELEDLIIEMCKTLQADDKRGALKLGMNYLVQSKIQRQRQ